MTSPHLTPAEVAEITEPLTQGYARCRFFERMGCKVVQKPNGQPLVSRAEYEAALTTTGRAPAPQPEVPPRPDFGKLRAIGGGRTRAVN